MILHIFYISANAELEVKSLKGKNENSIPLGLGMALMQNPDAFFYFNGLDAQQQQKIIDGTKNISSRDEMRSYVDSLRFSD